jgi:solute carrier family 25 2-oxodicarboxylate transporter 21
MDALTKIVRAEGALALYNGLEATLWRHASWNGGYFGCIQGVKSVIPEAEVPLTKLMLSFYLNKNMYARN